MRTALIIAGLLLGVTTLAAIAPAAQASGTHAHIAIIVEENRNLNQVIGAPDMPYFNSLARGYSSSTHWTNVYHPSEPNYIALASGSNQGVYDDLYHSFGSKANLGGQLTAAGISWKAYMESMPSVGYQGDAYPYMRKHDPFIMFSGNDAHVVPATQYTQDLAAGTLPDFIFYVPNMIHDGHDASNSVVDTSLKSIVQPLMADPWYTSGATHGGTIVVTWDEEEGQGVFAHVIVSENAKIHANPSGNHFATLRTVEDAYGLARLGAASSASSFASLLGAPATTSTTTPTPTPTTTQTTSATFSSSSGNEWWVQVKVAGSVAAVASRDTGGAWVDLAHRSYGWSGSYHVEPGHLVQYEATLTDGSKVDSCWYTHPAGVCTTTPTTTPTTAPTATTSTFQATFSNMRGNAYWVETDVATSGGTLTGVDASVNGGAWIPLAHTSWGSWAKSIAAPAGSQVRFRADASDGSTVVSAAKTW